MQTKKRIKVTLIIILMLVEVFTIHLMYKSTELKDKELPKVNIKNKFNANKRQFAIMLETSVGSKEYENRDTDYPDALPTDGYRFNSEKSGCIDINGKEVKGILDYDYGNYILTLTPSNTVYCYLYYDVYSIAYMKALVSGSIAEPTYIIGEENQQRVEKVEFVDYIPENLESEEIVAHYDLTDTSKGTEANSVIGWLVKNENKGNTIYNIGTGTITETDPYELYDFYIGSTSKIYGTDMSFAFQGMTNLKTITFNNLDTSEVTDMSRMFFFCANLISLDLSNFNTSQVINMSQMFQGCNSLTDLDLSNFNTSNVTDMRYMFFKCSNLTTLDLSNFDTSQVTIMGNMFNGCSNLATLNLSNFDTSQVTNMNSMFDGCSKLTTLDLSNFNTSKVTEMGRMFSGLNLTTLNLSNFDTSNVTYMAGIFSECSNLTSLDLSNFNTSKVTSMSHMFSGLNLTTLNLSNFDTSKVTEMVGMFSNCSNLTTLDVSNFNTSQVTNMSMMFSGLNLTTLDLSNFDTSQVTDMSMMFNNSTKLKTIDMRIANFGRVTNYFWMFGAFSGVVPSTATMHVKAGQESFIKTAGFGGTIVSH